MRLGINVSFPEYYISGIEFADVMKRGRRWYKCNAQGQTLEPLQEARIDSNGWPQEQSVSTVIGSAFNYRAGTWRLAWTSGLPKLVGPGVGGFTDGAGFTLYQLSGSGSVGIMVPGPASGISLRYAADPPEAAFAGDYLARLRELQPTTIRFLDWQNIRGVYPEVAPPENKHGWVPHWEARPRYKHARWSENIGVPLEVCCELTNQVGCEAWFHIPHAGRDAETYALGVESTVEKFIGVGTTGVTYELANEAWNDKMPAYHYFKTQPAPIGAPGGEIGRVAWGYGEAAKRLLPGAGRRVLMGHVGNVSFLRNALKAMGDAAQALEAIGCAAYLPSRYGETPLEVIQSMRAMIEPLRVGQSGDDGLRGHRALANELGVKFRVYECGRGVHQPTQAAIQADTMEEMGALYTDLFTLMREEGVDEALVYATCQKPDAQSGSWGSLVNLGTDTPKWRAMVDWNKRS